MKLDDIDLSSLEPQQLSAATRAPLPRARMSRRVRWLLAALRIYVLIAVPVVIYAFFHALSAPPP